MELPSEPKKTKSKNWIIECINEQKVKLNSLNPFAMQFYPPRTIYTGESLNASMNKKFFFSIFHFCQFFSKKITLILREYYTRQMWFLFGKKKWEKMCFFCMSYPRANAIKNFASKLEKFPIQMVIKSIKKVSILSVFWKSWWPFGYQFLSIL